jgi:hypothetical protein
VTTIWKYPIPMPSLDGSKTLCTIPLDALFLSAGRDADGGFALWFEVEPSNLQRGRRFEWFGTGNPLPGARTYLASTADPPFVWHLYEVYS